MIAVKAPRTPPAVPWHLLGPPLLLALAATLLLSPPGWAALGLGVAGWTVALGLRAPLAIGARASRLDERRMGIGMVIASGPVEEGVRWGAILFTAGDPPTALWIGLGWALAESFVAALNSTAFRLALHRDDAVGDRARQALSEAGTIGQAHPAWAALERFSVGCAHIGFALWIAWSSWLVLPAAAMHSIMNLVAISVLSRGRSIVEAEAAVAAVGGGALALGLLQWT